MKFTNLRREFLIRERDKEREKEKRRKQKKLVSMSEQKVLKNIDKMDFDQAKALLKKLESRLPDLSKFGLKRQKTGLPGLPVEENEQPDLDNSKMQLNQMESEKNSSSSSSFLSESTWFYSLKAPTIQSIVDFNGKTSLMFGREGAGGVILSSEFTRIRNAGMFSSMEVVDENKDENDGKKTSRSGSCTRLGNRGRFRDDEVGLGLGGIREKEEMEEGGIDD